MPNRYEKKGEEIPPGATGASIGPLEAPRTPFDDVAGAARRAAARERFSPFDRLTAGELGGISSASWEELSEQRRLQVAVLSPASLTYLSRCAMETSPPNFSLIAAIQGMAMKGMISPAHNPDEQERNLDYARLNQQIEGYLSEFGPQFLEEMEGRGGEVGEGNRSQRDANGVENDV